MSPMRLETISARSVKPEVSKKDKLAVAADRKTEKLQQIEVSSSQTDSTKQSIVQPIKILKTDSTFARSFGQRGINRSRVLTFSDEHGQPIAVNVYVEQLHYSSNFSGDGTSKGCCTLS